MKKIKLLGLIVFLALACKEESFRAQSPKKAAYKSLNFTQDSYPIARESFTQGFSGDKSQETFRQGEFGKLDILIVIDNSLSMSEEQDALSRNLRPLITKVQQSDWRIAVISTDARDRCHEAIISKDDIGAEQKFARAIQAGIDGAGEERGIERAVYGLGQGCRFTPWVREDSTIAVLIVSDEDNCHTGDNGVREYGCEGSPGRYGDYLTNHLGSIRNLGTDAKVYGLLWDDQICQENEKHPSRAEGPGYEYLKPIRATGGLASPICRGAQYGTALDAMSEDVRKILKYEFDLQTQPERESLQVLVNGRDWQNYQIQDRKLKFTQVPPFGADVEIRYTHGKMGSIRDSFEIPSGAAEGSIEVTINGVKANRSDYTYDATRRLLQFTSPPQDRALIDISYKKVVELKREFQMQPGLDIRELTVKVNGQIANGVRYDRASGILSFPEAPPEQAQIEVRHNYPETNS